MLVRLKLKGNILTKLLIIILILKLCACSVETVKTMGTSKKCATNSQDCAKAETRTKSRVESRVSVVSHNSTILNLVIPLNKCVEKECKHCCLSINRCGTKKQCKNSK